MICEAGSQIITAPAFHANELRGGYSYIHQAGVQHWASMENLKAASEKMFQDVAAQLFMKALDPESVKMIMLPQLKAWK